MDVLREGLAPKFGDEALVFGDQFLPVLCRHVGIEAEPLVFLGDLERFFERAMIEAEDDVGIHLNEAAIAVPRETLVARCSGEANHGFVVEAEIEDRVHHAWHRDARTRADRDEERINRIAKTLARHAFDVRDPGGDLGV